MFKILFDIANFDGDIFALVKPVVVSDGYTELMAADVYRCSLQPVLWDTEVGGKNHRNAKGCFHEMHAKRCEIGSGQVFMFMAAAT